MKRKIVIASHKRMAEGMKETLQYITGTQDEIVSISAYLDNTPVEEQIDDLMESYQSDDEVIIFTDILSGSVNQKFMNYLNRAHTHIVTGVNLPILMAIMLHPSNVYLSKNDILTLINEARQALIYVNSIDEFIDDDDE